MSNPLTLNDTLALVSAELKQLKHDIANNPYILKNREHLDRIWEDGLTEDERELRKNKRELWTKTEESISGANLLCIKIKKRNILTHRKKRLNYLKARPKYQQNAVIYKISCKDPSIEDYYIGSSISFKNRLEQHKKSITNPKSKEYNSYKAEYIRNNGGWDNWEMNIIEKYSCNCREELEQREFTYIDGTCLNTITQKKSLEDKLESKRKWDLYFNNKYRQKKDSTKPSTTTPVKSKGKIITTTIVNRPKKKDKDTIHINYNYDKFKTI